MACPVQAQTTGHRNGISQPAPRTQAADSVRIAFVGDVLLADAVGRMIDQRGVLFPWRDATVAFEGADLVVGNLEMAITTVEDAEPKQFNFKAEPRVLGGAVAAGVDLFTLANNHAMDYGAAGLLETVGNLEDAGIAHVGAGADDEAARRPHIVEVNGVRIGFLGFSRVYPYAHWVASGRQPGMASGYDYALAEVVRTVRAVRPLVDALFVLVHWGDELAGHPREIDVAFADTLRSLGVTGIIGHHPHVLQGIDLRDSSVVAYSLGNFIFWSFRETTRMTGVLHVTLGPDGEIARVDFRPMKIREGRPLFTDANGSAEILERVRTLSGDWDTLVLDDGRVTTPMRLMRHVRFPFLRIP